MRAVVSAPACVTFAVTVVKQELLSVIVALYAPPDNPEIS